ncbi:helix-turn-helix domain-containing protein [Arthrobacter sp. ov118]|nr:helix-turn-helix domain-containing protein [Arthrobacter sp. ov118]
MWRRPRLTYQAKGNSVAEIQKLVGVSRATVYRYLSIEGDVTA